MRERNLIECPAPLVLAIDIGSSSVRALLYDRDAQPVANTEHQLRHTLTTTPDGGSTADPDALVALVLTCIDHVLINADHRQGDIHAVALSSFWHSLMGLAHDQTPTTPVYMWADKRSGQDAATLSRELDPERIHTETGCRLHSSYWPAKLRWLNRTTPDVYAGTATWASFTDYLSSIIHGELTTSISMASGTGLLDSSGAHWHPELLGAMDINPTQLPRLTDRDIAQRPPQAKFKKRWPALADIAWFPAIGDGAAANVGSGCVGDDSIALTIGTSGAMRAIVRDENDHQPTTQPLSPRLWQYRLDRSYRVTGGALSNGGNVTAWFADLIQIDDFEALTAEAANIPPDGHGLTVLPFLAGERSPSWNDHLTGAIAGLRLGTSAADIFRAFLESTAYRFGSIYEDLRELVGADHEIRANGAAALGSPLWMQILADTLNHPVASLDAEAEASARGAAICALESIRSIDDMAGPKTPIVDRFVPDADNFRLYTEARYRLERYVQVLSDLTDTRDAGHVSSLKTLSRGQDIDTAKSGH